MRRYWVKDDDSRVAVNTHFATEGKAAAVADALEGVSSDEFHVETEP